MSDTSVEKEDTTRATVRAGAPVQRAEAGRRIPQDSIETVVRQIVEGFQPEQIILFGSYAHGRPGPESDVDLLVVMDTPLREMEQAVRICQAIEYHFGLDLIVRTPATIARRLALSPTCIQRRILMTTKKLSPECVTVLKSIAAGYTYEQVLALHPELTYLDIFDAAHEALEATGDASSDYQGRLARIRSVYPRAYEKWTDEEDAALEQLVQSGHSAEEIANQLQRQPSAIRSRIVKRKLV